MPTTKQLRAAAYKCHEAKIRKRNEQNTGKKFDMLTILEFLPVEQRSGQVMVRALCDCGNETIANFFNIKYGKTHSCGCKRFQDKTILKGNVGLAYFRRIAKGALQRSLDFEITLEYAEELFNRQHGRCALSGLPITPTRTSQERGTASLDRIDNDKGYIEGNVQWLHKDINMMKNALLEDYFIELCQAVSEKFRDYPDCDPDWGSDE